jgi:ATP-dependent helicase Lhr and Lhr-like helicase
MSPEQSLAWAHPIVREWFLSRFGSPTEPQEQGWPHILAHRTTLIAAPTGSGKTLSAFLACIDRLVRQALAGELEDRTEVLYVSPLKALGNDIQKNLEVPLGEILDLAMERGLLMPEIRTAVRTGDTLMQDRRAMLKRPPHILVTTPESLYILLTAEKSRAILRNVDTVIVDEIHAVAGDKRGAHLALSLERLDALVMEAAPGVPAHEGTGKKPPVRIGLSATQKPIAEIAAFLTGAGRAKPAIVDVGHKRQLDLQIAVPDSELGPVSTNDHWDEIYKRIASLVTSHRSTLVFVNTRRLAERVAHHLGEILGEEAVASHHGSLARKIRLHAEHRLKAGELKVLVATASLQLGIDIGHVDLVIQISSPRSIAVALQRIGRAGHWRGAIPKGRILAMTRDELVECAAVVWAIHAGELDRILIPEAPLDVLAQQIVAACSAEDWGETELFELVRRAYPYRNLTPEDYDAVVEMLSEGIAARRGRYGAYLHRDRVHGRLRGRRGSRMMAITSGGAIPETAAFTVVASPEGAMVGTVDEDFAVESMAGDIFLLGNTSWLIRRVEGRSGRLLVEDAHGAPPTIPFWRGEAPARTSELSAQVAEVRQKISDMLPGMSPVSGWQSTSEAQACIAWLKDDCGLDDSGAEQAIHHVLMGRAVLGEVPTQQTVIAERFFDEGGGMQLVIHAPFGGRVNKAWGLALRKRFCRSFNFELQAAATDDGLNISLAEQHSFPLADVFNFLQPETVQQVVEQAVLTGSPIFGTRFRWDASRSLALLRFQGGKKVPPQIQRMRADDLLASVFPDVAACQENIEGDIQIPDHPLVKEVMKDVLTEAMDIEALREVLRKIQQGTIRVLAVDTAIPSQFSHEILNANPYAYLDDAPLEERRARAVEMRRVLPESLLGEVGRLDAEAIAQVQDEAWPDVRDADELHDALHTLIALPEEDALDGRRAAKEVWSREFKELSATGRAGVAVAGERRFWVAAERVPMFRVIHPEARFQTQVTEIGTAPDSRGDAIFALVTGWMGHVGPVTAAELARLLSLAESEIEQALLRLEATGAILRGSFRIPGITSQGQISADGKQQPTTEFCERRLLARIHRLTIGRLRKEIEPVTEALFLRWLLRWQHLTPGSQLSGERGLLEVLRQLQGFEIPANAWERRVLARRVRDYDPAVLDQLCLTGAVGWGRLSPHPATLDTATRDGDAAGDASAHGAGRPASRRRVIPTSVAPITFFVRDEAEWMLPHPAHSHTDERALSQPARDVLAVMKQRGASFFADIVRGTGKLKSEVETGLWELVAAGVVTADGFDNLRALIDPKRRSGQGSGRSSRPRHAAGRWSLLFSAEGGDRAVAVEATCRMLLNRYGVVFRELLAREALLPRWRELVMAFRRMEDRGEVRGGRFVSGFLGEQFALPVAVESLRALRKLEPNGETVSLSAADPLNLVGIVVPGERVPAISGKSVTYRDGVPVDAVESSAPAAVVV